MRRQLLDSHPPVLQSGLVVKFGQRVHSARQQPMRLQHTQTIQLHQNIPLYLLKQLDVLVCEFHEPNLFAQFVAVHLKKHFVLQRYHFSSLV